MQNAPADAGMSKRDSNAGTSDRRSLDALAPRAALPAPQSSAPAFQLAADVRPLVSNGSLGAVITSPALPGGTLTVRDTADLPQQIVQAMRFQLTNTGGGDAHIRLQPEYLGDLTISLRVERGDVNATLSASAPEVRQWIERHEPLLRQMLSDRGLQLSEFVVNEERQSNQPDEQPQDRGEREQKPPARRRAAQGATFEVLA
jgi:flagellar hook-length control protein FliK